MNQSVLILGGGGFIGSALSVALAKEGKKVTVLSRTACNQTHNNIRNVTGAFNTPADFEPWLADCQSIVHLASNSTPGSSAGCPLAELEGNLRVTLALLEALQSHPGCKLIYCSSGGTLYGDNEIAPATEQSKLQPYSYHGAGKAAAEYFISSWSTQFATSATILRPSNVYGPGQTARQGFGIIPTAFNKIIKDETLEIWGDGSAIRDYLYVADFIQLCLAIIDKPMAKGVVTLNAASGIGTRLDDLLSRIESVTGKPIRKTQLNKRQVDISRIVIDSRKAYERYDWKPQTSLTDGLKKTWGWWTNQK
jgi:UDP-glucose 4-epimerase